ncbi:hypothetical protein [Actinomadura sp. WMMB 499]|uniref:hypothetical protein n=1 Tax=Actinomadura sp. WMMB 499 TaxID=1219491 RepID=UPI001246EE86|nr:hypothetical protein [Actinomadura sp. WMMB 499]QFG22549.1 hypothetical protein F7P10_16925 [Actinomadura sp. WMMB 499]
MKNATMFVGSTVLTLCCLLPDVSLLVRVLGGGLFGTTTLLFLAFMVLRRVAFRVDAKGITVAGNPLRYRATLLFVPWQEVQTVVLWKQHLAQNMPYVGIQRNEDARPGKGGRGHDPVLRAAAPHVPTEIVRSSRAVNGWRLDRDRLAAAVAPLRPGRQDRRSRLSTRT